MKPTPDEDGDLLITPSATNAQPPSSSARSARRIHRRWCPRRSLGGGLLRITRKSRGAAPWDCHCRVGGASRACWAGPGAPAAAPRGLSFDSFFTAPLKVPFTASPTRCLFRISTFSSTVVRFPSQTTEGMSAVGSLMMMGRGGTPRSAMPKPYATLLTSSQPNTPTPRPPRKTSPRVRSARLSLPCEVSVVSSMSVEEWGKKMPMWIAMTASSDVSWGQ
mmetsp:Transcript_63102/g.179412  ORF Transcript_63102/g.179412 Transcript_63102/m.179412 type:complete len:220 (+) Transcript_63102:18-677(+)